MDISNLKPTIQYIIIIMHYNQQCLFITLEIVVLSMIHGIHVGSFWGQPLRNWEFLPGKSRRGFIVFIISRHHIFDCLGLERASQLLDFRGVFFQSPTVNVKAVKAPSSPLILTGPFFPGTSETKGKGWKRVWEIMMYISICSTSPRRICILFNGGGNKRHLTCGGRTAENSLVNPMIILHGTVSSGLSLPENDKGQHQHSTNHCWQQPSQSLFLFKFLWVKLGHTKRSIKKQESANLRVGDLKKIIPNSFPLPSGERLHSNGKLPFFHGKIHYIFLWPFSIAMSAITRGYQNPMIFLVDPTVSPAWASGRHGIISLPSIPDIPTYGKTEVGKP